MSGLSQRRGRGSDLDDDEDDDAGLDGFEGSSVRHQSGRRGKMANGSYWGGRGSDTDFGHRQPRGAKKFDFGLSEDDGEAGEVDEDDEPSGFEDDLFDDKGVKEDVGEITDNKSGSSMSSEDEPAKHESVQGRRSTGGGDSYLSQKR
jgi:ATP-dependent RNA helicase MSS116